MDGEQRRLQLKEELKKATDPMSGSDLAKKLGVSRQVIVQDIALLRAQGCEILPTYRGYVLQESEEVTRVFKVFHEDQDVERELTAILDCGGRIVDVFVYHKVYGVLRAPMNVKSRLDLEKFMEQMRTGKSDLLMNVTGGYHYHTVSAESEEILDEIQERLRKLGFLAKLQEYEPVDFWKKNL